MKIPSLVFPFALLVTGCSVSSTESELQGHALAEPAPAPADDPQAPTWSGMQDAPNSLSWSTQIAASTEPGERLVITGTVYQEDRTTPAADVLIYAYHTNIEGVYPKRGDELGNGKYHGYLRGWIKTDSRGRYRFETIRPAPYETHGGGPAHIHYMIRKRSRPRGAVVARRCGHDRRRMSAGAGRPCTRATQASCT